VSPATAIANILKQCNKIDNNDKNDSNKRHRPTTTMLKRRTGAIIIMHDSKNSGAPKSGLAIFLISYEIRWYGINDLHQGQFIENDGYGLVWSSGRLSHHC
jgi:hypothetical protein